MLVLRRILSLFSSLHFDMNLFDASELRVAFIKNAFSFNSLRCTAIRTHFKTPLYERFIAHKCVAIHSLPLSSLFIATTSHLGGSVTVGVPHRNCVAYKSVSGHLALRDDVNKDCFFLGHNTRTVQCTLQLLHAVIVTSLLMYVHVTYSRRYGTVRGVA